MRVSASLFLLIIALAFPVVHADDRPPGAAFATAHPLATEAAILILNGGGNAFDAAVAASAVLGVVEPYSSGMGGGGFWLLHRARDGHEVMVDGRETAPGRAHRDMYLDESGKVIPGASMDGPLAAGIPGEPAALVHIAEHYGRLPLAKTLAPAILLAQQGFPVTEHYRRMAGFRASALKASPSAGATFLDHGNVPDLGHVIRQPELANTLQALAERGRDGFYTGRVAEMLVDGVGAAGGIWTLEDLRSYRVVEREPIRFDYRGWRITSAPPPSSGGVALATMLNVLTGLRLGDRTGVGRTHLIVEAMRRAYRDRAVFLGDSDFIDVPVRRLVSREYAASLARDIDPDKATPSSALGAGHSNPTGPSSDTTHFSILDGKGNRVAATLSINYPFGSGFVAPGTGVLLNDEMDDFSAKPGVPNAYGLVGAEANAIAPGKRMLSSMSPTFMENDAGVAILGTPGGSRIITMVLHGILATVDGEHVQEWVTRPRFHHQYLPDHIELEPGAFSDPEQAALEAKGHGLKALEGPYGNMQAIYWDKRQRRLAAASDPRVEGSARVISGLESKPGDK